MQGMLDNPIYTDILNDVTELRPEPGSTYILGVSIEDRSRHWEQWERNCEGVSFVRVVSQEQAQMTILKGDKEIRIALRSQIQLKSLLSQLNGKTLYIDITGLSHHIWAPIIRTCKLNKIQTKVVYVEPGDYRFSANPTEGEIFDLSERISGISPLPGFATLSRFDDEQAILVPLLGFEGARLSYMLENVQPRRENVWPIVGVPGFRIEYPFFAYLGNRIQLIETHSWHNIHYVRANCPFSLYYKLIEIQRLFPKKLLKIAPIGTKPHALGAVLFFLDNQESVELVYDHPIRKAKRTEGTSRVCVYNLNLMNA